jgi:molecular chaperone GrpE
MQKDNRDKEDIAEFQVIDKRKFLTIDKADKDSAPEEKRRYPTYVEELMARMAETERKFQEKKKQIDEEISRTRTRLEADFERKLEMETQQIILPFLEVMDNLQRAVNAASSSHGGHNLVEGVKMTISLFRSKLAALGVEAIQSLQQPFDPNLQQAVGSVAVKDAHLDGIVLEELQTGYSMKGRLLRPAQVRVGRKP